MSSRTVLLFAFAQCQVLDVAGPLEVFAQANRFLNEAGDRATPRYLPELVSQGGGALRSSGGVTLLADAAIDQRRQPVDTLLVAGGGGVHASAGEMVVLDWLRAMAPSARRVGGICTGAFLLAAAGLLNGRRATTHWRSCALLAERYPEVTVEPDAIWVRDSNYICSAGVTAGIDLALALVEEDCGPDIALEIARNLVLPLRRSGGQSQFSAHLLGQAAKSPAIKAVQGWILDNLDQPLMVPALAERAAMSPRNFARQFVAEIGLPPGRFVERARVDQARRALETGLTPGRVAGQSGFPTTETMRRAFLRHLGVTPSDYQERFRV